MRAGGPNPAAVPTTSTRTDVLYLGRHRYPYSLARESFGHSAHPAFKPRHRADLDGIA